MNTFRVGHTGRRPKYAVEPEPAVWDGYLLDVDETRRIQQAIDGLVSALSTAGNVVDRAWFLRDDGATAARLSLRASREVVLRGDPGGSSGPALLPLLVAGATWPAHDAVVVFPLAQRCLQWPGFDLADPGTSEEFSFVLVGGSHAVLGFSRPTEGSWGPTLARAATWAAGLLVDALVGGWVAAGANAAACEAVGGLRWLNPDHWQVAGDTSRAAAFGNAGRAVFAYATRTKENLHATLAGFTQPSPAALDLGASPRQSARSLLQLVAPREAAALESAWVREAARAWTERAPEAYAPPARGADFRLRTFPEEVAEIEMLAVVRPRIERLDEVALQGVRAALEAQREGLGDLLDDALRLLELEHVVNHPRELEWQLEAWIRARVEEAFGSDRPHVTPPPWLVAHLGPYLPDLTGDFWTKLAEILWEVGSALLAALPGIIGEMVTDLVAPWVNILRTDLPTIWANTKEAVRLVLANGDPSIAISNVAAALLSAAGRIEFSVSMQLWIASTIAGAVGGAGAGGAVTGSGAYVVLEYVGIGLLVMAFASDLVRVGLLLRRLWNDDGTQAGTASDDFADLIGTICRLALMIVMIPLAFVALRVIGVIADFLRPVLGSSAVRGLLDDVLRAILARRTQALARIDGLTDDAAQVRSDALVDGFTTTLQTKDAPHEFVEGIEVARTTKQGQGITPGALREFQAELKLPNGETHTLTLAEDTDGRLVLWMCSGCGTVLRALRDAREAAKLQKKPELAEALDTLKTLIGDLQSNTHAGTDDLAKGLGEVRDQIVKLDAEHGADADSFFLALKEDTVVLQVANKAKWEEWLAPLLNDPIDLPDDQAKFDALSESFAKIGYVLEADANGEIGIWFGWGTRGSGAPKLTWDDGKQMVVPDPRGLHGVSNRLSDGISHIENWKEVNEPWFRARGLGFPPANHQAHHLVPDAVVREHPLFVRARVDIDYDLDRASNVEMLPADGDSIAEGFSDEFPFHRGSHPRWNEHAAEVADDVIRQLRKQKGISRDTKPADVVALLTPEELASAVDLTERLLRRHLLKSRHRHPAGHPKAGKLK